MTGPGRALRGAVLGCGLAVAACADGFFFEPAPEGAAGLGLRLAADALVGSEADAFDRADRITITLGDGNGGFLVNDARPFSPAGAETRVTFEVELPADPATLELGVVLGMGSEALFVGARQVTLRAGESTEATVPLVPVPADLLVPPSLPPFTAFGETLALDAARVTMATGDTIQGAEVAWTSAASGIVAVEALSGGGFRAVAVSEGATELIATHPTGGRAGAPAVLEGRVAVEVGVVVDHVVVEPSALELEVEESATLAAEARDRNGVPVPGRTFAWTSSADEIATVEPSGEVRGAAPGTARIFAAVGDVSGFADVRVLAPEPPPSPTGVSVTWSDGPRLSWTDPSGGSATFRIERAVTPPPPPSARGSTDQATGFELIATRPAGSTSFVDPAPVAGELAYRVRACNPFACSSPSATVIFLYRMPPTVQTLSPVDVGTNSARLRGSLDPNGLETFAVFEVDRSSSFTDPRTVPFDGLKTDAEFGSRTLAHVEEDLSSGSTYYVRLVAFNEAGSVVGNTVAFTTQPGLGQAALRPR